MFVRRYFGRHRIPSYLGRLLDNRGASFATLRTRRGKGQSFQSLLRLRRMFSPGGFPLSAVVTGHPANLAPRASMPKRAGVKHDPWRRITLIPWKETLDYR